MVWFFCDGCGDTIKKPKVKQHSYSCRFACTFTCIDCSRTFDFDSVHYHTSCVTEHEKYALGATKAGGFAEQGFYTNENGAETAKAQGPAGAEFLSTKPPWKCILCNVSCTSEETLMGHASGAKHIRRAKAAAKAADGGPATPNAEDGKDSKRDTSSATVAPDIPSDLPVSEQSDKGKKKDKGEKIETKPKEKKKKGSDKCSEDKAAKKDSAKRKKTDKVSKDVTDDKSAAVKKKKSKKRKARDDDNDENDKKDAKMNKKKLKKEKDKSTTKASKSPDSKKEKKDKKKKKKSE